MPFLEKLENDTLQFPKKLKKNLDVDNDVLFQHAKFQLKTPSISGHTKMTKSENFGGFKVCTVHYFKFPLLLFLQYQGI